MQAWLWKAHGIVLLFLLLPLYGCTQQPLQQAGKKEKPLGLSEQDKKEREKYGYWYRTGDMIGTLGGRKVKMSYFRTRNVAYTDTPAAFSPERAHYKEPPRTYDSLIYNFGFDLNYETGKLRDIRNDAGFADAEKVSGHPWVSVGVYANLEPIDKSPEYLNRLLRWNLRKGNPDFERYIRQPQDIYGLEEYRVHGTSPRTGRPYREEQDDVLVARDQDGNISSYIRCYGLDYAPGSNDPISNPPCRHYFIYRENGTDVRIRLGYNRHRLYDWRRIESAAVQAVEGFAAAAERDIAAGNGNRVWTAEKVPESDRNNTITGVEE